MTRRKPRGLRAGEKELWDRVARSTTPMHRAPIQALIEAIDSIAPVVQPPPELPMFRIGQNAGRMGLRGPHTQTAVVRMDAKTLGRMRKGKLAPQGRIDLHGMTLAQAHPALVGFILNAQVRGHRLVLVITGKGRIKADIGPILFRKGVLKYQVPGWLAQPPLNLVVQQVVDAHARHGGGGALYVYLRRLRQ